MTGQENDYLGGIWVKEALKHQCVLLRYVTLRQKTDVLGQPTAIKEKMKTKMMIEQDANPEDYPELAFQHASLYQKGLAPEKKVALVAAFLLSGSVKEASNMTGISVNQVYLAKTTDWWGHLYDAMMIERGAQLKAQCTQLINSGMKNLAKRMETGDQKLTKNGEVVNLAVSARDSAFVVDAMTVQYNRLEDREKKVLGTDAESRLLHKIAEGLTDIAQQVKAKDITPPLEVKAEVVSKVSLVKVGNKDKGVEKNG